MTGPIIITKLQDKTDKISPKDRITKKDIKKESKQRFGGQQWPISGKIKKENKKS